ncbi:hypothetical protein WH5701_03234 [Synechococcus sp. WH 5701]|nr:hypothetical protein WH5701_03234 [Synechococcus sp. WH 5701]
MMAAEQTSKPSPWQHLEAYRIAMFEAHCRYLLAAYLQPWAASLSRRLEAGQTPPALHPERRALIVDDRPSPVLRACVLNTLLMGRLRLGVTVISSTGSHAAMTALFAGLEAWVRVEQRQAGTGERFGWEGYNRLFKSAEFWSTLEAAKLLIFQADALLIEPPEEQLFEYAYVGSPWSRGQVISWRFPRYSRTLEPMEPFWQSRVMCSTVPEGLVNGNGGVSIRDRGVMEQICRLEATEALEPEDIYFSRCLARHVSPKQLPSLPMLERFCCETQYQRTCAAHASWRYLSAADQAEIYERHAKQVIALIGAC